MSDAFHSEQDELGLLGCILGSNLETAADIAATVTPGMLFSDAIRDSYEVALSLVSENVQVTLPALDRAWSQKFGKRPAPLELWANAEGATPSASNHPYYSLGIREAYQRRKLRDAAHRLIHASGDPSKPIDAMIADLEAGIAPEGNERVKTSDGKSVVRRLIDDLQERSKRKGKLSGIPTGFWRLDSMTDGLQFGELFLCGARPSIGKTAIGVNIVRHACVDNGWPTLVVSCEMSELALMRRLASDVASIPLRDMKQAEFNEGQWRSLVNAGAKIGQPPLHFMEANRGETIDTINAEIRRSVRRFGIKLVIVDYLQKIHPGTRHEKRTYEVAEVSTKLKAVAASTGVALLCLAQLSRENEKEKGRLPRLTDLADSAQIERDADVVTLLHRDRSQKEGEAVLLVAKQRDGECGAVPLYYRGQFCRFESQQAEI